MASTWLRSAAVVAVVAGGSLVWAVAPAAADVVTPAGACVGSGEWRSSGQKELSTAHLPTDVIKVPRADTVKWSGNQKGYALGAEGPRRDISGAVQLVLPIGTADIDTWGGSSVRYANEGEHSYDLPNLLVGVTMELKGHHDENGKQVCSGSVFVELQGDTNPLSYGAIAGLVISGGVLLYAGKPVFKKKWAFEDVNPG